VPERSPTPAYFEVSALFRGACTTPVDDGSRRVMSVGARVLHDPDGLLIALQTAVGVSGQAPNRRACRSL